MAERKAFSAITGNKPLAAVASQKTSGDVAKAPRDERIEALVKARDAAIQKQKIAESDRDRLRAQAESAAALQTQVEALRGAVAALERQQFESRQFEQHMALITSALERERDLLQREVLKFAGMADSENLDAQLQAARAENAQLIQEKRRVEEDALMRSRMFADKLDAEELKNEALQRQLESVRDTMGTGIEELKMQMESGLRMALARVDQMESLLWAERSKSKKYLKLLSQLVDKEDLEVLLAEEEEECK